MSAIHFRSWHDPKAAQQALIFGHASAFYFCNLGALVRLDLHPDDRALRFRAQALARKAAGRARLEYQGRGIGRPGSVPHMHFVTRVAEIAMDMQEREAAR